MKSFSVSCFIPGDVCDFNISLVQAYISFQANASLIEDSSNC